MYQGAITKIHGARPTFPCPECGTACITRTSEAFSKTLRRLYYQCQNVVCSHSFTCTLAFEKTLSPPGKLTFKAPPERRDLPPPVGYLVAPAASDMPISVGLSMTQPPGG